jgi:hypothetical protein
MKIFYEEKLKIIIEKIENESGLNEKEILELNINSPKQLSGKFNFFLI